MRQLVTYLLSLSLLFLLRPAAGQTVNELVQIGAYNEALVDQIGIGNVFYSLQQGNRNAVTLKQEGSGNLASFSLTGSLSEVLLDQQGANNRLFQELSSVRSVRVRNQQQGLANTIRQQQLNTVNSLQNAIQQGSDNSIWQRQYAGGQAMAWQEGRENAILQNQERGWLQAMQSGAANRIEQILMNELSRQQAQQYGDFNQAYQTTERGFFQGYMQLIQSGNNNLSWQYQSAANLSASLVEQLGDNNQSRVYQNGQRLQVIIIQRGNRNQADVAQYLDGQAVTILQDGYGNRVLVIQQ